MKIFTKNNSAKILSFAILVFPTIVYGASLIPCGQSAGTPDIIVNGVSYVTTNPCGFNDLIILANTIIHFLMIDVAVPLAALGFMYVGGRLVILQNKESEWEKAKEGFADIGKGFAIMLGAYVLIKTILFAFLDTSGGFTLFLFQ